MKINLINGKDGAAMGTYLESSSTKEKRGETASKKPKEGITKHLNEPQKFLRHLFKTVHFINPH